MIRTGKVVANNDGNCDIEFVRLEACGKCGGCKLNNTPAQLTIQGDYNVGDYVDVKNNISNGSIILLNNINNLDIIIKYIKSKGYDIVPLEELLTE